jgi:hypothetical protein
VRIRAGCGPIWAEYLLNVRQGCQPALEIRLRRFHSPYAAFADPVSNASSSLPPGRTTLLSYLGHASTETTLLHLPLERYHFLHLATSENSRLFLSREEQDSFCHLVLLVPPSIRDPTGIFPVQVTKSVWLLFLRSALQSLAAQRLYSVKLFLKGALNGFLHPISNSLPY